MKDLNKIVEAFLNGPANRYILLSPKSLSDGSGVGYPYVGLDKYTSLFITLFTSVEIAEEYGKTFGYLMEDGSVPYAKLPEDNKMLVQDLIGCMQSGIHRVVIMDTVDDGISIDIFRFIQDIPCELESDMIKSQNIPAFKLINESVSA